MSGRSREIAAALDGEVCCLFPPEAPRRPHVAVRYLVATVVTSWFLVRHRPRGVIVTDPPLIAGIVALAWCRILRGRVVLDSHPGSFGAQGDTFSARLQVPHRWLVTHVDGCAVASEPWVDHVRNWGGTAIELHEAPSLLDVPAPRVNPERLRILCVGRLAPDEPTDAVIGAATLTPDCDFYLTGDTARIPGIEGRAPANVTFTGYLGPEAYDRAVRDADVVLTLTTEPSSVMRAAYEAVYAGRPLIVTDWPIGRSLFPYAVHVANDASSIAAGAQRVSGAYSDVTGTCAEARRLQLERWEQQLVQLRILLGLADHGDSNTSLGTPSPPPCHNR